MVAGATGVAVAGTVGVAAGAVLVAAAFSPLGMAAVLACGAGAGLSLATGGSGGGDGGEGEQQQLSLRNRLRRSVGWKATTPNNHADGSDDEGGEEDGDGRGGGGGGVTVGEGGRAALKAALAMSHTLGTAAVTGAKKVAAETMRIEKEHHLARKVRRQRQRWGMVEEGRKEEELS